jgi:hypothetical protein
MLMPSTANRVSRHTSKSLNRRIATGMEERLTALEGHSRDINKRLAELDREWDIERAIEANASVLALGGIILSVAHDRRWIALPALVTAFLFQHSIQGWCPPVPVLRRMGFRTAEEINQERYALKAMRGDFNPVRQAKDKSAVSIKATRKRRYDA